ncbi:MAG: dihydroorotase [Thermodesulfovibrionales bacterium]|nr:dihydroorotase [Thermodesulfovibrionales bacterium]
MDNSLLVYNGHIVDPIQDIDGIGSILIEKGKIKEIYQGKIKKPVNKNLTVIDVSGCYILPGLIDMHTHLREPGYEHKETIHTGTKAAIHGGFTSLCCMPNTLPINDNATVTSFIIRKAYQEGFCKVYPIGAITKGQQGQELAEMGLMREAGAVAFSDDGKPVMNSLVMRRALEYSKTIDCPIISHAEDINLSANGLMNEGELSYRLGLAGIPKESEEIMVARDVLLAKLTKGRLHIAHVSTKKSVSIIRRAKEEGVMITAETCPHYFSLTEDAIKDYDTNAKVNPPLRTLEDVEAIKDGLKDGTIDVIATDHAPHHKDEKLLEFDKAPFGISGLETAVSLSLKIVKEGVLSISDIVLKMSVNPSAILKLNAGNLKVGSDADLTILNTEKEFILTEDEIFSKGKNTPLLGSKLTGKALFTIVRGKVYNND